ncbi:macrophage mannose receptor 1-like [Saccostrea cucullata]|uniref:macrophage mannose receptor 1-like n=1 Tax=Saccostrea cuccullata TaxID=36930 RepID=UPI002ED3C58C
MIILLLFLNEVSAQSYKHTTYARQLNTNPTVKPIELTSKQMLGMCGRECHASSTCSSFFFNGTHCVTLEASKQFSESYTTESYFTKSYSVFHFDIVDKLQSECSSHGYVYDPLIPLCYKINAVALTKADAVTSCQQSNGHLLRINTYRKQLFVESLKLQTTSSVSKYRIDGKKQNNGIWTFSDGREIVTFHWYPGEPQSYRSSIALTVTYKGLWDDVGETIPHGFICERVPQKIIDDLLAHYDKRISPTDDAGDGPVTDYVQLYILSLDFSSDKTMVGIKNLYK